MSAPSEDRQLLIGALRAWLERLESGGSIDAPPALAELLQTQDQAFYRQVAELTRRLHTAVVELRLDERLSRLAGDAIPDARSRLHHVVHMTEAAAHRTLDLVDQMRGIAAHIAQDAAALRDHGPAPLAASLAADAQALRGQLSELATAQEYQDLTGQIIKRIIALVEDVEAALLELLGTHAGALKTPAPMPISETKAALAGPAMPGQETTSQQDADALLASLGV
ncbi:protein phosphatase CheZ [Solimonas variicoloris]|uniref:protein phosphatase CheZ n=1 Tax=Solimonas variicoloris TaxID=254408 RepID=UPI00036BB09F|nr:protein phosphatase CheZ [Solimonas variicoloris]